MQLYRPMLKQALSITWKFKYLWFFGLFAALVGNGGAFNLGAKNLDRVEEQGMWLTNFKQALANLKVNTGDFSFSEVLQIMDVWSLVLFLLIIAIGVFLIWLAISCQGGLAYGVQQALKGRNGIFSEVMRKGSSKFWPVFLLNIVLNLTIFIALFLVSLPFMILLATGGGMVWQTILIILSFIVLVPVAIVLSLIVRYALIYVVNEDRHIGEAIHKAWNLFIKNWIVSLETGFLLFLLNILTGLALVIVMIFVALPFAMLGMIAAQLATGGLLWLIVALGILTFIGLMFLYGAMWNVFQMTVWVLLFEKISSGNIYSKVLRWAVWLTGGGRHEDENA